MLLENLVDKIMGELGLSIEDTLSKGSKILCIDTIYALILEDSIKNAASLLEVTENTLEQTLRRHFKIYCNKDSKTKWSIFLLSLVSHRKCIKCNSILDYSYFSLNTAKYNNKNDICKICDGIKNKAYAENNKETVLAKSKEHYLLNKSDYLARNAQRRALKLKATPTWADFYKIKCMYNLCPEGFHVDHIIPLQGELVCGLHVENYLQYLLAVDNLRKSNKFIGE